MRLAALAAVLACAWPGTARASKLDARLSVDRERAARRVRAAGAGAPEPVYRVLMRVAPGVSLQDLRAAHPTVGFGVQAGVIVTATVPDSALAAFESDARVISLQGSRRYLPTMDVVRSSASSGGLYLGALINTVAKDLANIDGTGVVVGIVDTGIDYRHADFVTAGGASRIKYLWDQTDAAGPAQSRVSCTTCGTDWTNAQITASLGSGAPVRERDTNGHGTHVSGIAAGNGRAGNAAMPAGTFTGVAPNADIVFVKTDFSDAGILEGLKYIAARASDLGEPAVINLSLGNQLSPHDGTSNFEVGVDAVAASTPVVVAMGNDAANSPHAQMPSLAYNQTVTFSVSVTAGVSTDAQVDLWGASSDAYSVTVTLPGHACSGMTAASGVNPAPYACGTNSVYIYNAGAGTGSTSASDREMYVDVYDPAFLSITAVSVAVTCTQPAGCGRLDGFVYPGSDGTAFVVGSGYTVPQTMTIASPATANNVIAVGSYASKTSWVDSAGGAVHYTSQGLGVISSFSAWGPTRDGRQKPDVAAPGEGIGSSLSTSAPICSTCEFDSLAVLQDNVHAILQGTSMATPVVTGIIATRLQGHPTRTVSQLRAIVQGTARTDSAATAYGPLPNGVFGYGKAVISPQPVSAPGGPTAVALGVSSITWSWAPTTVAADAYDVYLATKVAESLALAISPPYTQTGLAGNTTYGIMVTGEGAGVDGPGAFITTATYAAAPASPPSAAGFSSSMTVTYSACPAAPNPLSCSGYVVQASTAADFSGTAYSSATTTRTLTQLSITGLSPNTNYAVRLGALNPLGGVTWGSVNASTNTGTSLVAPVGPVFDLISTGTIRFSWGQGFNPPGLAYLVQASTAPDYSGTLTQQTVTALNAAFGGLSADTSYYFQVQAVGGPFLNAGPAATLALAPLVSSTPFVSVGTTGLTAAWSDPGNRSDTLYKADLSLDAGFAAVAKTAYVRATAAAFTGLTANTAYYARAQAISRSGTASAAVPLGSTSTLVQTPALPGQPFSAQATDGFRFDFSANGNPAGTNYLVRVATDPGFAVLSASATTSAVYASFSGLLSNQLYYASVAGLNQFGTPSAFVGASTATAVGLPLTASPAISTRAPTALGFAWSPGTLAPGTRYLAQVSSSPAFAFALTSSNTANAYATLAALQPNTTYYARVQALSQNAPTPDGAFLTAASGATLADPPGAVGAPFPMVAFTSVTVAWAPLPLSPSSAAAEGYLVELSTVANFATVSASRAAAPGASSATLTGLAIATTYYARVASLNWEGSPDYLWVAGSTRTLLPALSSGTQTTSGLTLVVTTDSPELTSIRVDVPPGTFPLGTVVSAITSVGVDVAGARSNEAAGLTPFGPPAAFELSAGGLQPAAPVRLSITYDPAQIPPGQDARRLHLWRYDPPSQQWTLMPSQADTSAHQLVASIQHFSSFAPFFVTAGVDLGAVQVFPQPWEAGDSSSRYWSNALSFTGLPPGAGVRLFTLTGEEILAGTASAGGVFTWDGNTRFGRRAASGTYYAAIEAAGAKLIRRVVVIR